MRLRVEMVSRARPATVRQTEDMIAEWKAGSSGVCGAEGGKESGRGGRSSQSKSSSSYSRGCVVGETGSE